MAPKSAANTQNRTTNKPGSVPKDKRKKRRQTYSSYIFKVLKRVHPEVGMNKKSMSIMNGFVNDIFDRICDEAGSLADGRKSKTLSAREIEFAVQLLFSKEIAEHSVSEGRKAVTQSNSSQK